MRRCGEQTVRARTASLVAAIVVAAIGVVMLGGAPAGALSCAEFPEVSDSIAEGDLVFLGTVVSTRNDGTWPTFAVEEVWSGVVADVVEVRADYPHDGERGIIAGYQPESFEPGTRYLVTAYERLPQNESMFGVEVGELELSPCGTTPVWSEGLAVDRPAGARIVARSEPVEIIGALDGPSPDDGPPWPWIAVAAGFVVIVSIGGALAWRSGGRRDGPADPDEIDHLIDDDRHKAGLD